MEFRKADILGVRVAALTMGEAVKTAEAFMDSEKPHLIATANAEMIMRATHDTELKEILNTADLVVPDGAGTVWASNYLGVQMPETHPPVSVYGTGTHETIAAFLGTWLTRFATLIRSTSRLRIAWRICQPDSFSACTGISIPGSCSPHASPQFCSYVVQESKPVVHRIRLSTSP